jgi:hypothetical protein
MQVELKNIFALFLEQYVKVHLEIKRNQFGFQTNNSLYSPSGHFTVSKHSLCITHWFRSEEGKDFEEFQIEQHMGKLLITKGDEKLNNKRVLVEFKHPTEPLTLIKQ